MANVSARKDIMEIAAREVKVKVSNISEMFRWSYRGFF